MCRAGFLSDSSDAAAVQGYITPSEVLIVTTSEMDVISFLRELRVRPSMAVQDAPWRTPRVSLVTASRLVGDDAPYVVRRPSSKYSARLTLYGGLFLSSWEDAPSTAIDPIMLWFLHTWRRPPEGGVDYGAYGVSYAARGRRIRLALLLDAEVCYMHVKRVPT